MIFHRPEIKTVLAFLLLLSSSIQAQPYDILIVDGHLIDPANGISGKMDIAIKNDRIAAVEPHIGKYEADTVIPAAGLYVVPGLIDMHVHVFHGTTPDAYLCNSYESLPPDGFTFRSGVTTVVDAGCAGWKNFELFKRQTIDRAKTRVLAFINIVGSGMAGGVVEQNLADMDPEKTSEMAGKYPDIVVGIKLAHFEGPDWTPTERAVQAAKLAGLPVMIDFGISDPPLALETLFADKLRPGDIFTHVYANIDGRMPIVDENGNVRNSVLNARARGIVFDVGHGGASFVYAQAMPAMDQGFVPDVISTDLHTGSMNAAMKDQLNVMSKFLNMGMPLEQVIACATSKPAKYIHRPDLGQLAVGAEADLAILRLHDGDFGFTDTQNRKISGSQKLDCALTIRGGKVVWDLNGISCKEWSIETRP
jgi:dihydroorotase